MTMRTLFVATLLAASLAAPAFAQVAPGAAPAPGRITMVGTASREVEPDVATLSVGVTTEKASPADAANENAAAAQKIVAEAKAAGIEPADVRTSALTLSPVYSSATDAQAPTVRGYRAANEVTLRIRKIDQAGAIVQRLIEKGVTNLSGPTFSLLRPEAILDDLRGDAAKDARRKADLVAAGLGATVGRVIDVRMEEAPPPVLYRAAPAPAMMRSAAPPVEAGTQRLSTSVIVTFEIAQ